MGARPGVAAVVLGLALTGSALLPTGEHPHPLTLGLFALGYGGLVIGVVPLSGPRTGRPVQPVRTPRPSGEDSSPPAGENSPRPAGEDSSLRRSGQRISSAATIRTGTGSATDASVAPSTWVTSR